MEMKLSVHLNSWIYYTGLIDHNKNWIHGSGFAKRPNLTLIANLNKKLLYFCKTRSCYKSHWRQNHFDWSFFFWSAQSIFIVHSWISVRLCSSFNTTRMDSQKYRCFSMGLQLNLYFTLSSHTKPHLRGHSNNTWHFFRTF